MHDDVDLVVELMALPEVYQCLSPLGLSVSEDHAPVRVVLRSPDGRQVDLHPVTFDEDGTGWQVGASPDGSDCPYPPVGFASGEILGNAAPCLSAELQLEHHRGYTPRDRDRRDAVLLASRFGQPSSLRRAEPARRPGEQPPKPSSPDTLAERPGRSLSSVRDPVVPAPAPWCWSAEMAHREHPRGVPHRSAPSPPRGATRGGVPPVQSS